MYTACTSPAPRIVKTAVLRPDSDGVFRTGGREWRMLSDDELDAMRSVEYGDGSTPYGDWLPGSDHSDPANARAWGPYQLHKEAVDDVNRIYGTSYTYDNRLDEHHARRIAQLYTAYYGNRNGRTPTAQDMWGIHNGGPNGASAASTQGYRNRVQSAYDGIVAARQQPESVQPAQQPAYDGHFAEGQTVWDLYKASGERDWTAFLQRFSELNPELKDLTKIRTGTGYRLK